MADATIIPALQPVLVLLVASRMFGERIRRRDLVLGGCGLAGVLTFIAVVAGGLIQIVPTVIAHRAANVEDRKQAPYTPLVPRPGKALR